MKRRKSITKGAVLLFNTPRSFGIILLICISLSGCLSQGKENQINQNSDSPDPAPDYIFQDVTHYYYEDGIKKTMIMFESGEYYSEGEELYVENCTYIYYDIDGNVNSRGSSDRAKIFNNGSLIISEDNVVIISETNNAVLETEYLEWHADEEQFVTDRFVTVTRTNGDIITGYGMLADLAIRFVTINKDAKGSFKEDQD
jgi:LPS export ABC transporter protein LptC